MAPESAVLTRSNYADDDGAAIGPTVPAVPIVLSSLRPTRREVIDAIAAQAAYTKTSRWVAWRIFLTVWLFVRRNKNGGIYRLSRSDMLMHHYLLDRIFPDDQVSRPGTAHDFFERHFGRQMLHTTDENDKCVFVFEITLP